MSINRLLAGFFMRLFVFKEILKITVRLLTLRGLCLANAVQAWVVIVAKSRNPGVVVNLMFVKRIVERIENAAQFVFPF
jgi:hypothetical protein